VSVPARVPTPDDGREFGLEKTLPADAYRSRDAFDAERERLFYREWFCVGREREVPEAGDFLALDVAGERVLLVRAKDGALHGFYDVCRHRGCRLSLGIADSAAPCDEPVPAGRFKGAIRCPYHAWTYGPTRPPPAWGTTRWPTCAWHAASCTRWPPTGRS
jgi:phenylpropionate dioxygenase-like ring-hydroxylating dioxygenase large terminal subunit